MAVVVFANLKILDYRILNFETT